MASLEECQAKLPISGEVQYPDLPFFVGEGLPCRFEAEVYNCSIRGQIPKAVEGTFYRIMPDPPWAPLYDHDIFINGDGCVNALRFHNGSVDFKSRYVRTEKFCVERAARKAVYGFYRNRYSDDPRVKHKIHSTANTHVVYFENQILALKEDSKPYAIDPDTLETKGYYDFHNQYTAPTHTAHPKIDAVTGEMVTMGYETKGDQTNWVTYYLFDKNGKKLEECWVEAPYAGMMHDMSATDKWIIFALIPLEAASVDELQHGSKHFAWNKNRPLTFGILPRRNATPEAVRWFEYKNAFYGHTGNSFDGDDGCVYLDAPLTYGNLFHFFPGKGDEPVNPHKLKVHYVRWRFDPNAKDSAVEPTELVNINGEFPKVDDRVLGKKYNIVFLAITHVERDASASMVGPSFNSIAMCDVSQGTYRIWYAGHDTSVGEAVFVPRSPNAPEADGYLLAYVNRASTSISYIVIIDTAKIEDGPIAIVELPFRLRSGIHGSWVPAGDFPERKDLCDMSGISAEVRREFEDKPVATPFPSNAEKANAKLRAD